MESTGVDLEKNKSASSVNGGSNFGDLEISSDKKLGKRSGANREYEKKYGDFVSIYITSCENGLPPTVNLSQLKEAMPNIILQNTVETKFGVIINLNHENAHKILKLNLAKIFGKPVQAVPLYSGHYRKIISFEDIPWCIRTEELEMCLKKQGIGYEKLTREKSTLYVEVSNHTFYQNLREMGINFYDSVIFRAAEDTGLNEEIHYNNDNIIQCYKCQGFWHTANACKQRVRCVRCGEDHPVDLCKRPKNSPICCNCKGTHHAAYKLCPVRLKLKKSVRVSFTFNQ